MMKTAVILILAVCLFIGLLIVGFKAYFRYLFSKKSFIEPIAENIQINSKWLEIEFDELFIPARQVQKIILLIRDYENDIRKNDYGNIKLTNGKKINPEIEIVDENGKIYHLKDSSRIGNNVGFSLNKKLHGTHSFPKDVKYKIIRIRSDETFRCKQIYWYDYNLK